MRVKGAPEAALNAVASRVLPACVVTAMANECGRVAFDAYARPSACVVVALKAYEAKPVTRPANLRADNSTPCAISSAETKSGRWVSGPTVRSPTIAPVDRRE